MKQEFSPIFIVGASRTGTTMMNRVLGNHSDILSLNELHYIGRKWDIDREVIWSRKVSVKAAAGLLATARRSLWDETTTDAENKEAEQLFSVGDADEFTPGDVFETVLSYLLRKEGKKFATDQTPRNILYVERILKIFPHAKVIQLIRDPRAVLYSQKNRWRQRFLGSKNTPLWNVIRVYANYHVFTVCKLWKAAYLKGKAVVNYGNYMAVSFEELVDSPTRVMSHVCRFLSVDFDPSMLSVPQVGSSNLRHRNDVRGISPDVLHAWEGNLSNVELWLCQKLTGAFMLESGYKIAKTRTPYLGLMGQILLYPLHILAVLVMNPRLALRIAMAIGRKGVEV